MNSRAGVGDKALEFQEGSNDYQMLLINFNRMLPLLRLFLIGKLKKFTTSGFIIIGNL